MKYIFLVTCVYTLFACASPKTPLAKSEESKKKETSNAVKPINKSIPQTNSDSPLNPTPRDTPDNQPRDVRSY